MNFDLIHGWSNRAILQQLVEVTRGVIAHADRSGTTFCMNALQGAPALSAKFRDRPMNQVQIHNRNAQRLQAVLERIQRRIGSVVIVPQFGGQKDRFAPDTAGAEAFTDLDFVSINAGGINMPISVL